MAASPRISRCAPPWSTSGFAKLRLLKEDLALAPRLHGPAEFRRLIVGWGSTGPAVIEALERVRPEDTSYLHCGQLYPLSPALLAYLERAERIIVIEGNATGQFAACCGPSAAAPSLPNGINTMASPSARTRSKPCCARRCPHDHPYLDLSGL